MEDYKVLYEKMLGHRNALAIRNASLEFDLALAQDRIRELEPPAATDTEGFDGNGEVHD